MKIMTAREAGEVECKTYTEEHLAASVIALHALVAERDARIAALEAEVARLRTRLREVREEYGPRKTGGWDAADERAPW